MHTGLLGSGLPEGPYYPDSTYHVSIQSQLLKAPL